MPRRGRVLRRMKVSGDPVYGNELLQRFINNMMLRGKKATAEKIVYGAVEDAAKKLSKEPLEVFTKALSNVRPVMEVRPRRVGGATYQVPVEVAEKRSWSLAIKWMRDFSRERAGKSMIEKLSGELVDAFNGAGGAVRKREDTHKVAESNRAFAHFRW